VGVISADEPIWRSASRCEGGACIEIGILSEIVIVRRSRDPDGPRIALSREKWQDFIAGVKEGSFDRF
jgi:Domain of unknown function (DUF397)